jgi:glutamate formiminotransferase/formiminotetrahydrofolate cyclodeaminase
VTGSDVSAAMSLAGFLDELEAPAPSRSGGTAAAAAGAMAASLVTMVGRGSKGWAEGPGVAAQAHALRERLLELGDADARAYEAVLKAMRQDDTSTPEQRDFALGQALVVAALMPLAIAETSADVAELAALATVHGKEPLRPDAAVAAALAESAAHAGAHLVEVNLSTIPGDNRSERAAELVNAARAARARALGAL